MESRDMVGRLESTFLRCFKGRKVFTYHDGRLLSHSISFYQHHTRYHVNGFGGVGGVSTSCEASIGMVVLQFGDFALFQAGKSIPATVDCHFSQSYCPMYLPSYNIRCLTMNSGGLLLSRDRIGRKRLNQPSRHATKRIKVSNQ
jgi:hypothetical protein